MAPKRIPPLKPPPNERPNWNSLNEGQRRYAWEQYNLARVRRGKLFRNPDVSETQRAEPIAQPTAATESSRNSNYRDANPDSDDEAGETITVEADVHQPNDDDSGENNSGPNYEDLEQAYIDDFEFEDDNMATNIPAQSMEVSSAGTKRPSSSTTTSSSSKKKAPGTGRGTDGSEPSLSGDTGVCMEPIPRPIVNRDGDADIRIYRKVHRFTTFGLAYKPIAVTRGSTGNTWTDYFMTTPLAEIPWNRLFMYMNPSEYALLPLGSEVEHLHIQIRQRNVRVAFNTNSTTSELATLNQNKNAIYADGLLQYCGGNNIQPTSFDANQAMVVTGINTELNNSKYQAMVDQFYGVQNTNPGFATGSPRHQFGIPYILPYYYAPMTSSNDDTLSGWPCLQEFYHEFNADETSNSVFLERSYKPRMGLITTPIAAIVNAYPSYGTAGGTVQVAKGTGLSNANTLTNYVMGTTHPTNVQSRDDDTSTNSFGNAALDTYFSSMSFPYQINQIIEKDQIFTRGLKHADNYTGSQPSLHIGIQPVQALTTKNMSDTSIDNSFTDTQCYWEVVCTAKVRVQYPTRRPLAIGPNVSAHQQVWRMVNDAGTVYDIDPTCTMRDGLYVTKFSPVPT